MRARNSGLFACALMILGLVGSGCATEPLYEEDDLIGGVMRAAYVQVAPARDPVVANPSDPMWRQYWFPIENRDRDTNPSTLAVTRFLDVQPGMSVADLGAGGGYHTFRLATAVGPAGHVLATDRDPRMSEKIAWEARARAVNNITVLRSSRGDLGLNGRTVDVLLINDAPVLATCDRAMQRSVVRQIADAVRPGGRFVYFGETPESSPQSGCDMPSEAEVIALTSPYFEVTAAQQFEKPAPERTWRGFALQLRRLDAEASGD